MLFINVKAINKRIFWDAPHIDTLLFVSSFCSTKSPNWQAYLPEVKVILSHLKLEIEFYLLFNMFEIFPLVYVLVL